MPKNLYAAYFTGAAGSSLAMFMIGDGLISGADVGGLKYDGTLVEQPDGNFKGAVKYFVPTTANLVTGGSVDKDTEIAIEIEFPPNFGDGKSVFRIDTPLGPVNARFEHLREMPNA
jgi:hypothetical protein